MTKVIELNQVSKFYGSRLVLDKISVSFESGKLYAILGQNGAGKSTLMRLIMKMEQIDDGQARVLGASLLDDENSHLAKVGYVSENLHYAMEVPIEALGALVGIHYPNWDQKIFDHFFKDFGLPAGQDFLQISRGQKMQLAFAIAAAIQPKILLLDEITSVLDANIRAKMMVYLKDFTRQGGTVLLATNIISEAQNFADHLVLVGSEKILLDIATQEAASRFARVVISQKDTAPSLPMVNIGLQPDFSNLYVMEKSDLLSSGFTLAHSPASLEEAFIYLTRKKAA